MITVNSDGTFDLRSEGERCVGDLIRHSWKMHSEAVVKELTKPNPFFERAIQPKIILEE